MALPIFNPVAICYHKGTCVHLCMLITHNDTKTLIIYTLDLNDR